MNPAPHFSFIIPCLNEEKAILACLKSIPRSKHVEIIVADGGSQDNTLGIAYAHSPDIKITYSEAGRAKQMNAGAHQAKGSVLVFLHADSLLPINCLESLEAFHNQNINRWGRFDISLNNSRRIYHLIEQMINWRSAWSDVATGDQGIFVKRSLFQKLGGYPDVPLMEDVALSKILRQYSTAFRIRSAIETSARRWERNGVFKTILLMWFLRFSYAVGVDTSFLHRLYYGQTIKPAIAPKELLIIFSKNPELGQVKTRLIPHIGEEKAYELYKALLQQTLLNSAAKNHNMRSRQHEIWIQGELDNPFIVELAQKNSLRVERQIGDTLSASLTHAFESALKRYESVIVIGGDCVSISSAHIEQAFSALKDKQCVIAPARDGGFVLLGFQAAAFQSALLENIDWGSAQVLGQLTKNIEKYQVSVHYLETLWDIDEYQDLTLLEEYPWFQEVMSNT